MGRKKWCLEKLNKETASIVAEKYGIDPFAALLIVKRGFTDDKVLDQFLYRDTDLIDPFTLPDMEFAVERINNAIFDYEKICVYGDYDADGVTATTLLYSYLEAQGANVTYMLPDRATDGYGLSKGVVDRIHGLGVNLIVTVDNGISAVEEAKYIKELGMDLVVTDHHLPGDTLPECVAVVDPHRADSQCEYNDFAGVGVAFKLASAIEGDSETVLADFADLIAIGTIADIVPLTGENRLLVKYGLNSINTYPRPGVEALIKVAGLGEKEIKSTNISFAIAPRINAAGRMSSAESAIELLLCEEATPAEEIAAKLDSVNGDRHIAENSILNECIAFIDKHPDYVHQPVLVVHGSGWHEGVLGIVASKLLEIYLRPVIVLSDKNGISKGSARSIDSFSLFDALTACSDDLELYGGHTQAAGLTIKTENIGKFISDINEYACSMPVFYPYTSVDCKLNADSITPELLDSLNMLEPFGCLNPSPIFGLYDLVLDGYTELGENRQHIKINCHKRGKTKPLTLMRFNIKPGSFPYTSGDSFDALVTLDKNVWNGNVRVSIIVKDLRPAGMDDDDMIKSEKLFDKIFLKKDLTREEAEFALPDRALFASIYTFLKKMDTPDKNRISSKEYEYLLSKTGSETTNLCKIRVAMLAMTQLGLIKTDENDMIEVPPVSEKFDLNLAPVMTYLSDYTERR